MRIEPAEEKAYYRCKSKGKQALMMFCNYAGVSK
jgi:hypothetical protein